ncbi:MAG: zinc ribbon domain-containing protein [Firmicutes bacterium]|jgi:putative FmdB family regulatory protein|nr:zinc ribbon domain-containing protein [Bacillota bacterium]
MPMYEFLCECGNRFEKLCKINDKSAVTCPECGRTSRRVMSVFCRGNSSSGSGRGSVSAGGG